MPDVDEEIIVLACFDAERVCSGCTIVMQGCILQLQYNNIVALQEGNCTEDAMVATSVPGVDLVVIFSVVVWVTMYELELNVTCACNYFLS